MLDLDRHLAGDRLGRGEGRRDVVDRAGRDVGRLERREPLRGRLLGEALAQRRDQLDPVLDAVAVRREPRVVGERRQPDARQKRGHWRSLPTATAISPSAVSNVSYGTMLGWALPSRPGATPSTNAFWAWLTSTESVDSKIDTSTRWPVPWAGDERKLAAGERREDPDRGVEPGRRRR